MTSAILIIFVSLKGSSTVKKRLIYLISGVEVLETQENLFHGKTDNTVHTLVKLPIYELKILKMLL